MTTEHNTPSPPRLVHAEDDLTTLFTDAESEYRSNIDEPAAWLRLQARLAVPRHGVTDSSSARPRPWLVAALAAGVVFGWFGWHWVQPPTTTARAGASSLEPLPASASLSVSLRLAAGRSKLPDGTLVDLEGGAQGTFKTERTRSTLEFDRGHLDIAVAKQPAERPFVVRTSNYEFVVLGTQFTVEVTGPQVVLNVTEGRVAVHDADRTLTVVAAGGHWSNTEEPLVGEAPPLQAPSNSPRSAGVPGSGTAAEGSAAQFAAPSDPSSCRDLLRVGVPRKAEACYLGIAAGSGLSAEMALYEVARLRRDVLADPAAALKALDEYESRFASGTLAPEVQMARVDLLARLGLVQQALTASEKLLTTSTARVRTVELRLLRGNLMRDQQHDCAGAAAEYQHIESDPTPRGDQAQWARARCLEQLGQMEAAVRTYRSYLNRPNAKEAARARARLEELAQ